MGRLYINSDRDTLTIDDNTNPPIAVSLSQAYYFLAGYTGELGLCEHIQAQIRAEGSPWDTATCVYSTSTGKVTIDAPSAGDFEVTWTDTDLRDILGFTGASTGMSDPPGGFTGDYAAGYCWLPNRSFSYHPVEISAANFWESESNSILHRSRDGTAYGVVGNLMNRAQVEYSMLFDEYVIKQSGGWPALVYPFEQFFEDAIHETAPVRVFPDGSLNGSTDFVTALVGDGTGAIGGFSEFAGRHIRSFNGLWDLSIPLVEYVEV
jgi:hypothetical protein